MIRQDNEINELNGPKCSWYERKKKKLESWTRMQIIELTGWRGASYCLAHLSHL